MATPYGGSLPYTVLQRQKRERPCHQWDKEQRRQEVCRLDLRDAQQVKADGEDHHRAAAGKLRDRGVGQNRSQHLRQQDDRPLKHKDEPGGA